MANVQGQAARRRSGASSNAYGVDPLGGCAGETCDDAYQKAAAAGSPRIPVGGAAVTNVSGAPSPNTLPRPKAKTGAGDISAAPAGQRANVLAERSGARYGIRVKGPAPFDAAAGPTMANARVVGSVAGRQAPNFSGGVEGIR